MNFLKKLGKTLATVGAAAADIEHIPFLGVILRNYAGNGRAGAVVDTILGDLDAVTGIIVTAEAMINTEGSGPARLAASAPLVEKVLLQWASSSLPKGKAIKHPDKIAAGARQITSGMADFLSGFEE